MSENTNNPNGNSNSANRKTKDFDVTNQVSEDSEPKKSEVQNTSNNLQNFDFSIPDFDFTFNPDITNIEEKTTKNKIPSIPNSLHTENEEEKGIFKFNEFSIGLVKKDERFEKIDEDANEAVFLSKLMMGKDKFEKGDEEGKDVFLKDGIVYNDVDLYIRDGISKSKRKRNVRMKRNNDKNSKSDEMCGWVKIEDLTLQILDKENSIKSEMESNVLLHELNYLKRLIKYYKSNVIFCGLNNGLMKIVSIMKNDHEKWVTKIDDVNLNKICKSNVSNVSNLLYLSNGMVCVSYQYGDVVYFININREKVIYKTNVKEVTAMCELPNGVVVIGMRNGSIKVVYSSGKKFLEELIHTKTYNIINSICPFNEKYFLYCTCNEVSMCEISCYNNAIVRKENNQRNLFGNPVKKVIKNILSHKDHALSYNITEFNMHFIVNIGDCIDVYMKESYEKPLVKFEKKGVLCIKAIGNCIIAFGLRENKVIVYDIYEKKVVYEYNTNGIPKSISVLHNGNFLCMTNNYTITLWTIEKCNVRNVNKFIILKEEKFVNDEFNCVSCTISCVDEVVKRVENMESLLQKKINMYNKREKDILKLKEANTKITKSFQDECDHNKELKSVLKEVGKQIKEKDKRIEMEGVKIQVLEKANEKYRIECEIKGKLLSEKETLHSGEMMKVIRLEKELKKSIKTAKDCTLSQRKLQNNVDDLVLEKNEIVKENVKLKEWVGMVEKQKKELHVQLDRFSENKEYIEKEMKKMVQKDKERLKEITDVKAVDYEKTEKIKKYEKVLKGSSNVIPHRVYLAGLNMKMCMANEQLTRNDRIINQVFRECNIIENDLNKILICVKMHLKSKVLFKSKVDWDLHFLCILKKFRNNEFKNVYEARKMIGKIYENVYNSIATQAKVDFIEMEYNRIMNKLKLKEESVLKMYLNMNFNGMMGMYQRIMKLLKIVREKVGKKYKKLRKRFEVIRKSKERFVKWKINSVEVLYNNFVKQCEKTDYVEKLFDETIKFKSSLDKHILKLTELENQYRVNKIKGNYNNESELKEEIMRLNSEKKHVLHLQKEMSVKTNEIKKKLSDCFSYLQEKIENSRKGKGDFMTFLKERKLFYHGGIDRYDFEGVIKDVNMVKIRKSNSGERFIVIIRKFNNENVQKTMNEIRKSNIFCDINNSGMAQPKKCFTHRLDNSGSNKIEREIEKKFGKKIIVIEYEFFGPTISEYFLKFQGIQKFEFHKVKKAILKLFHKLLVVINRLHQRGIVHGAIKKENIRIFDDLGFLSVNIFDLSNSFFHSNNNKNVKGSFKNDIYAYGIIFLQFLTRNHSVSSVNELSTLYERKYISNEEKLFFEKLLHPIETKRFSASEALESFFFSSFLSSINFSTKSILTVKKMNIDAIRSTVTQIHDNQRVEEEDEVTVNKSDIIKDVLNCDFIRQSVNLKDLIISISVRIEQEGSYGEAMEREMITKFSETFVKSKFVDVVGNQYVLPTNKSLYENEYFLLGKLMCRMFIKQQQLKINFGSFIYHILLNYDNFNSQNLEEWKQFGRIYENSQLNSIINLIRTSDLSKIDSNDDTFKFVNEIGEVKVLNNKNRKKYLLAKIKRMLLCDEGLKEKRSWRRRNIESLRSGFFVLMPENFEIILKNTINSRELELILYGVEEITSEILLNLMSFNSSNSKVNNFLKKWILESKNRKKDLWKLFHYLTGSNTLGYDNKIYNKYGEEKKINVKVDSRRKKSFYAHECSFSLDVGSDFESFEEFKKILDDFLKQVPKSTMEELVD